VAALIEKAAKRVRDLVASKASRKVAAGNGVRGNAGGVRSSFRSDSKWPLLAFQRSPRTSASHGHDRQ